MGVKLSVIIPVYNEQDSVSSTISDIKGVLDSLKVSYEIIAVNDCSKDDSLNILDKVSNIKVLSHKVNKGYGASLKKGIKNSSGEYILIIDADGTYPVREIPKLLSAMKDNDMVVGARTGKNVHVPILRKPAKFVLRKVAKILTGINIPDLNSGLRIFKRELALKFWNLFPQGFSFTTTITLAALTNNYDVEYVPIDYLKRKGKSSINPIKDFFGFSFLIFKTVLYFNPLKFFIPASTILFFLGILWAIRDFMQNNFLGQFSVTILLVSILIFFFGMLADLVNKRMQ